jgi:cell division protein FtsI/penicillin-binding protein 2
LCGKTGTAEVGPVDKRTKNTWFIGFGEREGRLYSLAIVVEGGLSGGMTCAPIAKAFFENWFPPPPAPAEEEQR